MPIKSLAMLRVEPKVIFIGRLPEGWATDKQKDNLSESLKDWAREQRFATVRISPIGNPLVFGFKATEEAFMVKFLRQNDTETWAYSLTKEGLCESSSYRLGAAPASEPKLLYSWKDFGKSRLQKPG